MSRFILTIDTKGSSPPSVHTCHVRKEQVRSLCDKAEKEFEACLDTISTITTAVAGEILATQARKYEYCYAVYENQAVQIDRANSKQAIINTN